MTDKLHELADAIEDLTRVRYMVSKARSDAIKRLVFLVESLKQEKLVDVLRLLRQPDNIISRIISGEEPECEHNYKTHYELIDEGRPKVVAVLRCTKCGAWKYERDTVWQVPYTMRKIYAAARARREGR